MEPIEHRAFRIPAIIKKRSLIMKFFKPIVIAATLLFSSLSVAGTVTLESSKHEQICAVQITTGNNISKHVVNTHTDVKKGFTTSAEDRLCYRRSAKPAQCDSPYTEWTCMERRGSGTSMLKLS